MTPTRRWSRRHPLSSNVTVAERPPDRTFDLVICIASSHALGGFPDAFVALHDLVEPGGQVLLGEGYWRRPPTEEYLDALGGATADELADYGGLMRAGGGGRLHAALCLRWRARPTGTATSGRRS